MPNGSVHRGLPFTAHSQVVVVGALSATVALLICLLSLRPELALLPAVVIGIALAAWVLRYTIANPVWLVGVLALTELATGAWFLTPAPRAMFHYGMVALFCLPMLPAAWRDRSFVRGGLRLYTCYFLWAGITLLYSLAPEFSAGRLLDALLIFGALTFVTSGISRREDVHDLLVPLMLACGIVTLVVALSALMLPKSITWIVPTDSSDGVVRFTGIFDGPNTVGELMLLTVGCAAVLWPSARRQWRLSLAALIAVALGAAALADSRTPFIALAVGG